MTKNKSELTTIIWDWNGTLLNDVEASIDTMNELLEHRNFPLLNNIKYKEVFGFPVKEYYKNLGFDFQTESWEAVAAEYMDSYHTKEKNFSLFEGTVETLSFFKSKGYKQYILSAMKTESINKMLMTFNINTFFDGVYGLDHHYADGKVHVGKDLLAKEKLSPSECLLLGDTIHDAEVADNIGISGTLISNGHQSYDRLKKSRYPVIKSLADIRNKF